MSSPTLKNDRYRTLFLIAWGGFLISAILGVRYILPPEPVRIDHFTIEGTVFSLYLADLFFLLLLPFLFILIKQNKHIVKYIILLILPLLLWSLLSTLWAPRPELALYGWMRLAQAVIVGIIIAFSVRDRRLGSVALWVVLSMGILEATMAILQTSFGHSLGLGILGEPSLSLDMPGVAKVDLPDGNKMLRGYGTFPHPNILGAFLLLSSGLTVWALKKFGRSLGTRFFLAGGVFIQFLGILSTFSRSALLALLLGMTGVILSRKALGIPWKTIRMGGALFVLAFFAMMIFEPSALIARGVPPPNDQFVRERIFLFNQERHLLGKQWIHGTGIASYPVWLTTLVPRGTVEPWQYEYPHAVPLAILGDLGLIGLFLLLVLLTQLFLGARKHKRTQLILGIGAVVLLPLLLLDHYLWTVQPGRLLLWSALGLCFSLLSLEEVTEKVS